MNRAILLVEDNADDEALTLRAFQKSQILNPIKVARDGQQALDCLFGDQTDGGDQARYAPAVILLDLKLPKVDGLEVLRRIRANERTEEQDVLNGYSLGCNSYIRKPVDFHEFVEAVEQLGVYWLVVNEPPPSP